jgi:hypothetical protein
MITLSIVAQVTIAFSIAVVWVLRFDNIVSEFKIYRLPSMLRNIVGASKIVLATLLVVGIWHPELVFLPSMMMAALMVCAQITHLRVKSPAIKFLPSLALLILSLFVAGVHSGMIV